MTEKRRKNSPLTHFLSLSLQAEKAMKEAFGQDKGMSDAEVKAFVESYIPAYQTYLPALYDSAQHQEKLGVASTEDVFMFEVDPMRNPV